jgi:hypothetical protein
MDFTKKKLETMSLPELKEFAIENNISRGNLRKQALITRIEQEMGYLDCPPPKVKNPKTNRCVIPSCPEGQTRDKETKKCRDKKKGGAGTKGKSPCPEGQTRDKETNKCRDKKKGGAGTKGKSPCPEGQTRDKETKKCRDKKKGGAKKKAISVDESDKDPVFGLKRGTTRNIIVENELDFRMKNAINDARMADELAEREYELKFEDEIISDTRVEIECGDIKGGKTACENELGGEEHDGFRLRRCKWNQTDQPNSCELLKGSLDDRLRVTLGLSKDEFALRKQTTDDRRLMIQEEVVKLRKDNNDVSDSFEKAMERVTKRNEDSFRSLHSSAKKTSEEAQKTTKEIMNNKEISKEVKARFKNVTADILSLSKTEQELANAKAGRNIGIQTMMLLENTITSDQEKGIDNDDDLDKIGFGYGELDKSESTINTLETKMDEDRKKLADSTQLALDIVSSSDLKTKEALDGISTSSEILSSIDKACHSGRVWDSFMNECVCIDGEDEDGVCNESKITDDDKPKKSWYEIDDDDDDDDDEDYSDDEIEDEYHDFDYDFSDDE